MQLTHLLPESIDYYASVGFAYLQFNYKNYPVDWDGICIEISDIEEKFTLFKEANFFYFRPTNSVAYNENNEIIMKDNADDEWLYYESNGDPIILAANVNRLSKLKVQLYTKSITLTRDPDEEKMLYFAPYRIWNGKRIIGKLHKTLIFPGENFINLDIDTSDFTGIKIYKVRTIEDRDLLESQVTLKEGDICIVAGDLVSFPGFIVEPFSAKLYIKGLIVEPFGE